MLFLISVLLIIGAMILGAMGYGTGFSLCLLFFIVTVGLAAILSTYCLKCKEEKTNVEVADDNIFRLKIVGNYATWEDANGNCYIVPTYKISLNKNPDNNSINIVRCKTIGYFPDWVKFLVDFEKLGMLERINDVTYEINLPAENVLYFEQDT